MGISTLSVMRSTLMKKTECVYFKCSQTIFPHAGEKCVLHTLINYATFTLTSWNMSLRSWLLLPRAMWYRTSSPKDWMCGFRIWTGPFLQTYKLWADKDRFLFFVFVVVTLAVFILHYTLAYKRYKYIYIYIYVWQENETDRQNLNLKTLFYKDCSLYSVKICLTVTTSPC